jgi:hypothetical protein
MNHFSLSLFPPINRDYSILALRPLLIAGMVIPVVGGDGGINISIVSNFTDGVLSVIDPYDNMQVGDKHDIYWNTTVIGHTEVLAADIDTRLFIYLQTATIVPDWAETVFYRLTRTGTNIPEDSVPMRLRVKLDRPAGVDKDPHLPGHSELQKPQLPKDVIDNGVTAAWAATGIPVDIAFYPGRAARDTLLFMWGSVALLREITEQEASGTAPITLTVDQATILAGGDSDGLLVQYEVFDEVWNYSEDWSQSAMVKVDAGAWRLDAPIIKDAVDGVIDLIKLGKVDATVQIAMPDAPFAVGDTITITWIGTPLTGKPVVHTEAAIITNVPAVLELKIPNADVRAIAHGSADVAYVLTKANGDPPQSSKRAFAQVVGDVSQLPAPTIREVIGDVLEADTPVATVEIAAYPGMDNGDEINLIWLGTQANGTPYIYERQHTVTEGEKGEVITLPVSSEHIALLERGTLDLYYRVANDKAVAFGISESEHSLFLIQPIRAELPAPTVVEALDGVLDPALVPNGATVRVAYLGTLVGDELTYYWIGGPANGSASDWIPITTPIAGKPITFLMGYPLIEANLNRLVTVRYSIKRAATGYYTYSAPFELVIGALVGDLPAPQVLEATNAVLDPMNATAGVTVRVSYESMQAVPPDAIGLKWAGTPGAGSSEDMELPGDASGQVDFTVPATVVGANIGKAVAVSYNVIRSGLANPSDVLDLTVTRFLDPEKQLPRPQITQADNTTRLLLLSGFTGNADLTIAKWPFSAAGQRIWLRLEGKTAQGATYLIPLLAGVEISATQASNGISEQVLRSELAKLGHDSPLMVVCNVAFDGAASEASAISFPGAAYTFKAFDDSIVPTITSVKDSAGVEIPAGGTTFGTSATLAGQASPSQQVEIFDGAASKGTVSVNSSGAWTLPLTGLTVAAHSITAKALYGTGPVSAARTFTVAVAVTPTITSVRDSKGEVGNGGITYDTTVTVAGKASASQQVQILDGATSKGNASVNGNGDWTHPLTGLALTGHSITAKGLYASNPVSGTRTFTVRNPIPPLTIDKSTLTLSGGIVRFGREPTNPPAGSYGTRTASGGTPPYTYSTANGEIVDINSTTGRVISFRSGQTTITVRDASGQTASYQVSVSNVRHIDGWFGYSIFRECAGHAASLGGTLPSIEEWNAFRASYNGLPNYDSAPGNGDGNEPAWSRDSAGGIQKYCIVPNNGAVSTQPDRIFIGNGIGAANGWAILNR